MTSTVLIQATGHAYSIMLSLVGMAGACGMHWDQYICPGRFSAPGSETPAVSRFQLWWFQPHNPMSHIIPICCWCSLLQAYILTVLHVAWLAWPGGKAAIESNDGVRNKLASIMSYHVVRPVPGYEAFTTPFMLEGVALKTFKNGTDLTVESNTGGNIKVKGGSTSADITQKDIYACKV